MKRKIFVIAVMLLACETLFAQSIISVHLGGAFPMGGFGESDMDRGKCTLLNTVSDYGGAGVGFDLGAKARVPVAPVQGLGIVFSADFMLNGMNSDVKDYFEDLRDYNEDTYGSCDITNPKYINIPILAGVNYEYAVSPTLKLYGEASLGINFRQITNYIVVIEDSYGTELTDEYSYDVATTFAFQTGVGFIVNEKFSIGLHYYGLGADKVTGKLDETLDYTYGSPDHDSAKFKSKDVAPSILLVQLGIHF